MTTPKALAKLFGAELEVAEVFAASKTRAFVLDSAGNVRFGEGGSEKPSPIAFTMPGMPLKAAAPMVHRSMNQEESDHTKACMVELPALAKTYGPIEERLMLWKGGSAYHDFTRRGASVVWRWGMNNAFNEKRRICIATTPEEASAFLAIFAAKTFKRVSPYFIEGRGCVVRSYAKGDKRELRGVIGNAWRAYGGKDLGTYGTPAEAEAAYDAWEHTAFLDGWMQFGIEIDKRSKTALP